MRVFTTGSLRSAALVLLLGIVGPGQARADEALRRVQQSLRDQGFYYGPLDGSPGDETTQALRRYQIRNGLSVNGQLNDETRNSIERTGASGGTGSGRSANGDAGSGTPPPLSTPPAASSRRIPQTDPTPASVYRPPPTRRVSPEPDEEPADVAPATRGPGNIRPDLRVGPGGAFAGGGGAGGYIPREGIAPSATLSTLFASTPYEFAPPPVQADVLKRAQSLLARNGFYDGGADGAPGPATTEALTNFQEVNRLRRTGRLDVSTLGTMRLLPGRQTVNPRRAGDPRRGPDIIFQGRVVD